MCVPQHERRAKEADVISKVAGEESGQGGTLEQETQVSGTCHAFYCWPCSALCACFHFCMCVCVYYVCMCVRAHILMFVVMHMWYVVTYHGTCAFQDRAKERRFGDDLDATTIGSELSVSMHACLTF